MTEAILPKRWSIYTVDLEPRVGSKPGKQRPCIAIQPTEFSEAGLTSTVVVPLTTKIVRENAFPLRVLIPKGTCGLNQESAAMIDQILAWDNQFFRKELGYLPEALQEEIKKAIIDFLGFH